MSDATPMSSPFVERPRDGTEVLTVALQASPIRSKHDITQETISSLEYQLTVEREERETERLHNEQRIRELESCVKDEGRRADELNSSLQFIYDEQKEKSEEFDKIKGQFLIERAEMESRLRQIQDELDQLRDGRDQAVSDAWSVERRLAHELSEKKELKLTLEKSVQDLQLEVERLVEKLEAKQNAVVDLETQLSEHRTEVLASKSSLEKVEAAEIVQQQLSDQIKYSHELEDKLAKVESRLKNLEESEELLHIVQEEKESLVTKLEQLDELRQRAVDSEMQVLQLEQEKERWFSYLSKDDNFSAPEDVVRALMQERVEKIGLLNRLGRLDADLAAKDVTIVESSLASNEAEEWKAKYEKEASQRTRLQRQKDLTLRECTFLRDQLASFEAEESMSGKLDEVMSARIKELEQLLDDSRKELSQLSGSLAEKDGLVVSLNSPKRRARQSGVHDERLSESLRKNRALQVELENAQLFAKRFEQETNAYKQQIRKFEESKVSKERVLELRINPTSKFEKIKFKTLENLRAENNDLQKQLKDSQGGTKMVPLSVVDRVRNDMDILEKSLQEQKKSKERLTKAYQKMSNDLRQIVYGLTGYQIDPQPNKKVRVKSIFAQGEDETLIFVPDPASKTPKFIGIEPHSPLTREYENLVTFWVQERKDIPCFLAALNLELYDRSAKAAEF